MTVAIRKNVRKNDKRLAPLATGQQIFAMGRFARPNYLAGNASPIPLRLLKAVSRRGHTGWKADIVIVELTVARFNSAGLKGNAPGAVADQYDLFDAASFHDDMMRCLAFMDLDRVIPDARHQRTIASGVACNRPGQLR